MFPADVLKHVIPFIKAEQRFILRFVCKRFNRLFNVLIKGAFGGEIRPDLGRKEFCYTPKLLRWAKKKGPKTRHAGKDWFAAAAANGSLETMMWLLKQRTPWDEKTFTKAAKKNNMTNIMWLKEHGCPWNHNTFFVAAKNGNLQLMQLMKNAGHATTSGGYGAAINGNLENIKWLYANGCKFDSVSFAELSDKNNFEAMKWLHEQGYKWERKSYYLNFAVHHGNFPAMKWLKENGCRFDDDTFTLAIEKGNLEHVKWLHEQGCYWVHSWSSPNGEVGDWLEKNQLQPEDDGCVYIRLN